MIRPGIEFKAVKCQSLSADWDLGEVRPHIGIEAISVHSQVRWGVPKSVVTS